MPKLLEVAPGVVQVPVLGAQVWLLLDEPLTLVDTGTRGSGRAIRRAIERLGHRPADLATIVVTHYHPDHVGALPELLAARPAGPCARPCRPRRSTRGADDVVSVMNHAPTTGGRDESRPYSTRYSALGTHQSPPRVAIHAAEAPFLRAPSLLPNPFQPRLPRALLAPFWPLVRLRRPCPVQAPLGDGDAVPGHPEARLVHLPGHTPGSSAVYFPARGLLLAGDAFEYRGGRLAPPARRFTEDWAGAWASIRRLAALDFETLCLSHFPPLRQGAARAVRALAATGY
jgi:glyoxylase-like metal-dependent hydrolase (beta-lactamase superfamily II)